MKTRKAVKLTLLGLALYGLYKYSQLDVEDFTNLDDLDEESAADEKLRFRERLEADLAAAENRYK